MMANGKNIHLSLFTIHQFLNPSLDLDPRFIKHSKVPGLFVKGFEAQRASAEILCTPGS